MFGQWQGAVPLVAVVIDNYTYSSSGAHDRSLPQASNTMTTLIVKGNLIFFEVLRKNGIIS